MLMAVGSVPNTEGLGLTEAGVTVDDGGFVRSTECRGPAPAACMRLVTAPAS